MPNIVEIIIRQGTEGGNVLKDTASGIADVAQLSAKAIGTVAAVGAAIGKAFDLGEEAAAIIQTEESFDLLLQKVGASPDLFEQLSSAADRTITDFKLMRATSTLLAGAQGELATNLANATPELLNIARAANKLNPSLGDTTFLYQSLATGIKRASPLILDNLGLTIKVGEANAKFAEQLGKSVDELTAEEQKMALLNETLSAGQVLIDQVGGDVTSATDDFARLDTAWAELVETGKKGLVPILADAAEGGLALVDGITAVNEALRENTDNVILATPTWEEYVAKYGELGLTIERLTPVQFEQRRATLLQAQAAEAATLGVDGWAEGLKRSRPIMDGWLSGLQGVSQTAGEVAENIGAAAASTGAMATEVIGLTAADLGREALEDLDLAADQLDQGEYDEMFRTIAGELLGLPDAEVEASLALRNLRDSFDNAADRARAVLDFVTRLNQQLQVLGDWSGADVSITTSGGGPPITVEGIDDLDGPGGTGWTGGGEIP